MAFAHRLIVVVCLLFPYLTAAGQTPEANKPRLNKSAASAGPTKDPEAERLARERREHALALLVSLGTDAGTFKDQALRARTQSRIADALWRVDRDRARTLFRKAWEAAEIADDEGQQRVDQDAREQLKSGGGYVTASPPELRTEVMRLAVKHDNALAEEFLAKVNEQRARDAAARKSRIGGDDKDYAISQRIRIAREILGSGDKERALQFADPVLTTIGVWTVDFLSSLRETDPAAADQRYLRMLASAAASPQSDPNTASLLSSYLFTPHTYFTFSAEGGSEMSSLGGGAPADVAPPVRAAYFRAAAEILMRPISQGEPHQGSSTVINKFYVVRKLFPLFAQFAPAETTAALRTQLDALSSMVSENQRRQQDEPDTEGGDPQEPKQSFEQTMLDKIDRAKTSVERDQLYFQLATSSANAGNLAAQEYANKIDEMELRNSVRAYVDASLALSSIEKKQAERALEIARTGELTHLQRVWTLSRAAALLAQADRARALQILEDATTEARRIGGTDADRPRAMLVIANALWPIDRARGWGAVDDAVRAGNSAPDFTGADGQLTFRILTKHSRSITQEPVRDFDVAGIFKALALENYERAVELAQVFEQDAPRSHAVIAIALAVLDEQKK